MSSIIPLHPGFNILLPCCPMWGTPLKYVLIVFLSPQDLQIFVMERVWSFFFPWLVLDKRRLDISWPWHFFGFVSFFLCNLIFFPILEMSEKLIGYVRALPFLANYPILSYLYSIVCCAMSIFWSFKVYHESRVSPAYLQVSMFRCCLWELTYFLKYLVLYY